MRAVAATVRLSPSPFSSYFFLQRTQFVCLLNIKVYRAKVNKQNWNGAEPCSRSHTLWTSDWIASINDISW